MQASEDAKKLVNQEKSFACAEIESARAVVQRIGEALDEQARISQASKNQAPVSSFYQPVLYDYINLCVRLFQFMVHICIYFWSINTRPSTQE